MGYCSICANLKSVTKGAKTTKEKEIHKNLLQAHLEAQELERKKTMHHREKSLKKPEQYVSNDWWYGPEEDVSTSL